ncbi:MAG: HD domain-containing protein [Anaerolineales bacterium]
MIRFSRVRYRVLQFWQTLWAPWRPVDLPYVEARLTPPLLALFRTLPKSEQHHAVQVGRALEGQGLTDPDLITAALLHDVGKARVRPRIWERVLVVLGEYFFPQRAELWSRGAPRGLRRGFVIRRQHPAWGAELAAAAGARPRTLSLIRDHHRSQVDAGELAALQAADDAG